jgi:hypothetical protein
MLDLAPTRPLLIGVVHLLATPGAPRYAGTMSALLERAAEDTEALVRGGCDALVVENFGDLPFFAGAVPPETVAAMTAALHVVRAHAGGLPIGVNVLRNDARSALALCAVAGAAFLRVNVHVGAAVTDQGIIEGRAAETLRERARLCPDVRILADVFVKHAAPLGVDRTDVAAIADAAADTWKRGLADALIVSGRATGAPPDTVDLATVRERVPEAPLLVGSGLDADNAAELLRFATGAICGTALKHRGRTENAVDADRVARVRAALG